ncbi:MAG TPA: CPBP family intramembrane glutamic endopeptidase [Candidatus Angelobacter sp.]|nr:CPBP family intramembrane glutamic endopeptidase [Candidatus Angelobacter sp.]
MRPLRALLIYIIAVFIGGALLAPPLYWLAHSFIHAGSKLATEPFHRYVDRTILGLALIGLWPFVKNLGFNTFADVGFVKPRGQMKKLGAGFLLGFISLAIVAALAFACHARHVGRHLSSSEIVEKLLSAAGAAILIATLEELLFRGAIFGALRKVFHWIFALLLSSMFYAIMHYFESARDPATVTWLSGLQLLPLMLRNFGDLQAIVPGFFNLSLAGLLLGWAYQRTGNLYFSIGLHMGWIFWVKAWDIITRPALDTNAWWWGNGRMAIVNGWVALPILLVTLLVFGWRTANMRPATPVHAMNPRRRLG